MHKGTVCLQILTGTIKGLLPSKIRSASLNNKGESGNGKQPGNESLFEKNTSLESHLKSKICQHLDKPRKNNRNCNRNCQTSGCKVYMFGEP